jgi:hypothetical protein
MAFGTLNVQSFKGADCDTDQYLVVPNVWERLAISKKGTEKFDLKKFNLRKFNKLEVRKQYQIKVSNGYAALENLNDGKDINRAWENITENIKTPAQQSLGLYQLKQHKPWFDEKCSVFLDQRKQAIMQWLQGGEKKKQCK